MIEFNKYKKIYRLGHDENKEIFSDPEDIIVMQEKIDGGNFRFYISNNGDIIIGSRTQQLTDDNGEDTNMNKMFKKCSDYVRETLKDKDLTKYRGLIFYGENCLSGDTIIKKTGGGPFGNEMTLRDMYNYQEGNRERISCYYKRKDWNRVKAKHKSNWWKKEGYPNLYSLDVEKDLIRPNKMERVSYSGEREVYEVTTRKGLKIKTTLDHRFWTPNGWKQMRDIQLNDCVGVVRFDVNIVPKRNYGSDFKKTKALFDKLKKENICECGEDSSLEVHHVDENPFNNDLSNLKVMCADCHRKLSHKKNRLNSKNREKQYEFDKIISIEQKGKEDCYDITMVGDENVASFVANNFIVHNCVKHTINYDWSIMPLFLGFDILDTETGLFLEFEKVEEIYKELGLDIVPFLKMCTVKCLPEINDELVPISKYALESAEDRQAEGIVFKNYKKQLMAKYVRDKFKEKNSEVFGGSPKYNKVDDTNNSEFIFKYCTNQRIEKIIFKEIDKGHQLDMKLIGNIIKQTYEDIISEEWHEILTSNWKLDFKKIRKGIAPRCRAVLEQVMINNVR